MTEPYIFDIRRSSVSDGPGVRTTVFFKGCNLDCFWCHNPEGKESLPQLAVFREMCISCGACARFCKNQDHCIKCFGCAEVCPEGARRVYGRKYSDGELLSAITADKAYYDLTGGGVTFSGGECMLYPEYLARIAEKCRDEGIAVAVDTAGCVPFTSFRTVMPYVDLFLYDIKCIDRELHIKGTGRDNLLILENLDRLLHMGKRIIVRAPVIPDFNEGAECEKIAEYCAQRGLSIEFLKYHELGISKKEALS